MRFIFFFDSTKALSSLDPTHRESYIALGAALENFLIAADHFNYDCSVDYFPHGESNEEIAIVKLQGKIDKRIENELFYYIVKRNTNRNFYKMRTISQDILNELISIARNGNTNLYFIEDPILKSLVAYLTSLASQKEYENESMYSDLYSTLRFSQLEAKQKGDGLEVKGLFQRLITKYIYHRKLLPWLNIFGISRILSISTRKLIERTPIIGLLTTRGASNLDYVKGGQTWERIALTATKYDLSNHPTSSPLELPEYEAAVRTLFNTGTMEGLLILFRLGYGPPVGGSFRQSVGKVIDKKRLIQLNSL